MRATTFSLQGVLVTRGEGVGKGIPVALAIALRNLPARAAENVAVNSSTAIATLFAIQSL